MADPAEKQAFLLKLRTSRQAWDRALTRIQASDLDKPGFCGGWSARDVVAHIGWYEQEMVNILRARAFISSPLWGLPADARNTAVHEELSSIPRQEVISREARVYAELESLLTGLREHGFNDPTFFPPMPADWTPWQVFASNTYEHYDDHRAQAETFPNQQHSHGAA